MDLDLTKITDLEFDGVDHGDYPDYCDAYVSSGFYEGRRMIEQELDELNENNRDFVYEELMDHLF